MNLHSIASQAISAVNPMIAITTQLSGGYVTNPDGSQVPLYTDGTTTGQVQSLTASDLKKLEGLNIQNVEQKVYLNGNFEGAFRQLGLGGDLLIFSYGSAGSQTYLVTAVLERWPDWCCVGVTMQVTP